MTLKMYTFEDLIDQLGTPGRFQVFMLLALYGQEIPVVWATLMMSFAGKTPDWWCEDDVQNRSEPCSTGGNMTYKHCPVNQSSCNNVCFDPQMRTVVSEVGL